MGIIIRVATHAGNRKLHDARRLFVAGVAGERLVSPAQREPRHRVMVEAALLPVAAIVAACAIVAIAALVDIVLDMACNAGSGWFPDRVADTVARGTARSRMFPDKGKARIPVMIEGCRFPARGRMAGRAVGAARPIVDIVPGMTRNALGGGSRPTLAGMA